MLGGLRTKTTAFTSCYMSHSKRFYARKPNWEREYDALYGPKLTKEQVARVLAASKEKYATSKSSKNQVNQANYSPDAIESKSTVRTDSHGAISNEEAMKEKAKTVHKSLDKLLMFPLFEPASDSHFQAEEFSGLAHKDIIAGPMRGYVPSVSKIINETMPPESRYFLEKWEKEMIEKLGYEGFQQFKKDTFARGHKLHQCIEEHLHGTPIADLDITPNIELYWKSIRDLMPNVSEVQFIESKVTHPYLSYTGYFDCVAKYKNTVCLIDWKTSKKQKADLRWTYDNPLQLVAYLGAYNFDPAYKTTDKVENALLVIAYEDGQAAHAHPMSAAKCQQYWMQWLQRLRTYWGLKAPEQDS